MGVVYVLVPKLVVAPQHAFAGHAKLLHDAPRAVVPRVGEGVDLVQVVPLKSPGDDGPPPPRT